VCIEPSAALPEDALDHLAGLTGLGWTAALLGYLLTLVGVGHSVVTRVVAHPVSLLYLGGVLPVVTLGLDRRQRSAAESNE
jgi:hypothetical protein